MAQIALPRHQVTQTPASIDMGTPLYQRRTPSTIGSVELIPNPHFVFPQRPADDSQPSDMSRGAGRRPTSLQVLPTTRRSTNSGANAYKRRSASALPDFTFNPAGQSLAPPTQTTPPQSPSSATPTTPSRAMGHRRGASEFIGGGHKRVGSMVPMSSSPTKGDDVFPPSNTGLQPGPPAGRRGHAHRRSGAISSHDLSFIFQPSNANVPRIDQTPATPIEKVPSPLPSPLPIPQLESPENVVPSGDDSNSPKRPPSRARVGFSETVEFIRPLSTISSDTETTMSTVRGHSVSNSLSSIVSGPSGPAGRMVRPSLDTAFEENTKTERPRTAGAILDMNETGRRSFGDLIGSKRPRSAMLLDAQPSPTSSGSPATPRHHKKRSFFWLEHRHSDPSVASKLEENASEQSLTVSSEASIPSPAEMPSPGNPELPAKASSSSPRKSHRKPRKVKSWATSIIYRKSKGHRSKLEAIPRRGSTPTLPTQSSIPSEDIDIDFDISPNFDEDNTVTIVSPVDDVTSRPKLDTDIASWKPRQIQSHEHDAKSPVIDLDAALGPFNTPTIGPVPRSRARGFSSAKKTMHSSMGISHRRTESAPELVPVEFRNTPTATGSTMADVFEEEEEDEEAAATPISGNSASVAEAVPAKEDEKEEEMVGTGIQVVETAEPQPKGLPVMNWNFDNAFASSRTSLEPPQPSPTSSRAQTPVSSEPNPCVASREPSPIEIVEDYEEPRISTVTRSSDSTITPTTTMESKSPEALMHLAVPGPHPGPMTPDSLSSSAFPSPDFSRGQNSFDTARLGTAASSITDMRTLNSMNLGEPGPDCRVSVDDVPSLTSSRSTMTNAPHANFPYVMPRSPNDRTSSVSSSMSSIPIEGRRKRTSIASLSRLMGSSFTEKSKLSIEQRPQSEHAEKPLSDAKARKSRRVSKMLLFWKHKDRKELSRF